MPRGTAKLTDIDVLEARLLYRQGDEIMALAERYGVHFTTMRHALIGHTWKGLPDPVRLRRPVKSEATVRQALNELRREERT